MTKHISSIITLLVLLLTLGQHEASAQTQAARDKEMRANTLSRELAVPQGKMTQVLSLISDAGKRMIEVSRDATLTKEEKLARCKQLGAERDAQIALLLTADQVKKLEAFAAAERSKILQPNHAVKGH